MNIYTDLVAAKDELRRAKDHEQTMRAIAEYCDLSGKNADDRKRELAFTLSQDTGWRKAVSDMRDCELAVDRAQAAIDQADAERREREWKIRQRLAEALERLNLPKSDDDIDWHDLHFQTEQRKFDAIQKQHERGLREPVNQAQAQREMDELFNT